MRIHRSLANFAAVIAVAASACPAHADCPPSTLLYGAPNPVTPIVEVAARVDTVFSIQVCDRVHARYDVPAGLVIASIDVACGGPSTLPSALETAVEDEFQLTGLAPGTPVSFNVVLHLLGAGQSFSEPGGGGGARLTATLLEGSSNTVQVVKGTLGSLPLSVNEPLNLSVAAVAGTPIRLVAAVRAEAFDGRGQLEGLLEFTGLPPGASLVSCRGYSSAAPVAARRTSWGRLKATYR